MKAPELIIAEIADAINQELRENGPADVGQYYREDDIKNGVRYLVDIMRKKSEAIVAAQQNEIVNARLERDQSRALYVKDVARAEAEISALRGTIAAAVEAAEKGCSCHGYECDCSLDNLQEARGILNAGLRPGPRVTQ